MIDTNKEISPESIHLQANKPIAWPALIVSAEVVELDLIISDF